MSARMLRVEEPKLVLVETLDETFLLLEVTGNESSARASDVESFDGGT